MPITKKRKVAEAPVEEVETAVPSSPEPEVPSDQDAPEDNDVEAEAEPKTPKTFKELGLIDSLCEAW
jgi:ATP-dependent RNA helicase DDX47/RRP3